jgi:GLPGLI family protein
MKKTIIYYFIFLSASIFSQQKTMKVVYKAEYLVSNMQKKISEQSLETKQYINQYLENYSKIEMELLFNNEESLFKPVEKLDIDNEMFYKLALNSVSENKIRYKNNKEKNCIVQANFLDNTYLYNDLCDKYSWEIVNDTSTINSFKCFKAKTKQKAKQVTGLPAFKESEIYVWFTPDIASSFGPCGYDNLPGLVLSVSFGNVHIFASEISFVENQKIEKPTIGIPLKNEDELITLGVNYMKEIQEKN